MPEATDTIESTARTDTGFETRYAVALSNPTRMRILSALSESDEQLTLAELATAVTDVDAEGRCCHSGDDVDRRTSATLYHRDLPKLADSGLVEWDEESRRAALTSDGASCADAFGL